jgi:hypothetical protein
VTVTFTAANQSVSATALDIIVAAGKEAGIVGIEEQLYAEDMNWSLEKLQRLIDQFNAKRELIYTEGFAQYNLIANHAPHTIGPSGDFNVVNAPVRIVGASYILSGSAAVPVDQPIRIMDADWWQKNPTKTLISTIVTHLYYERDFPLGQINFWPISAIINPVRLRTWTGLPQVLAPTTTLALPQGYWDALVLSLAIRLCPGYGREIPPNLMMLQKEAMKAIVGNNAEPPLIDTNSGGMPDTPRAGRPDFNFLTGLRE